MSGPIWYGLFGINEEDCFHQDNKIYLEYLPAAMEPRLKWETNKARSQCPGCDKKWSKKVVQINCNFCGRLVCKNKGCSLMNVTVRNLPYEPWLTTCQPCWRVLLAIIKSGKEQSWEIAKTYVLLDEEFDADVKSEAKTVQNPLAANMEEQPDNSTVTENFQNFCGGITVDLVSVNTTPPMVEYGVDFEPMSPCSRLSADDGFDSEVQRLRQKARQLLAAKATMDETLAALKYTEKRADELLARAGKTVLKDEWQRVNHPAQFPTGNDLKEAFQTNFLQFETFAGDVVISLGSLGHADKAVDMLVSQVMKPMYDVTQDYVTNVLHEREMAMRTAIDKSVHVDLTHDTITKQFWFSSMREVVPAFITSLSDEEITQLMQEMGDLVPAVHAQMLIDAEKGVLSNTPNDLRIPQVVRTLLLLFTYAMLSDPYYYLQPAPGTTVAYHADRCNEILSPGTRDMSQIKEGELVEVVLCGLYCDEYCEDTTSDDDCETPVVKCRIRRTELI